MRGSELCAQASRQMTAAGVPEAGRDARRLLAHVLKVPAGRLTLFLPEEVAPEHQDRFNTLVQRRCAREPVSHLTGGRLFYGRDFLVTPDVLDPRPETETLIEAALALPFTRVLDLGTGSGCILLTLLAERESATGVGIDLSPEALTVARRNSTALGLKPRATFEAGSWYDPIKEHAAPFDLIVSNPPYIALDEMPDLTPEVRDFEPRLALTDEADGLTAYGVIAAGAPAHLAAGGHLLVEIGSTQGAAVASLLVSAGFCQVAVIPDLDGRDRVVLGKMPPK